MDFMEFDGWRMDGDNDEDNDAAFQYMIQQSLLDSSKKKENPQEPPTGEPRRSGQETARVPPNQDESG